MRIELRDKKKKKVPQRKQSRWQLYLVTSPICITLRAWVYERHGCHDNKHLRRVLEKLMI